MDDLNNLIETISDEKTLKIILKKILKEVDIYYCNNCQKYTQWKDKYVGNIGYDPSYELACSICNENDEETKMLDNKAIKKMVYNMRIYDIEKKHDLKKK